MSEWKNVALIVTLLLAAAMVSVVMGPDKAIGEDKEPCVEYKENSVVNITFTNENNETVEAYVIENGSYIYTEQYDSESRRLKWLNTSC